MNNMYWHWTERIADQLIKLNKPSIVITAGVTPSGPVHLGTVCEFLFPEAIYRMIKIKNPELDVKMYFMLDVLDALDSVTADLKQYEDILKNEMGKPLEFVKDPKEQYKSYADRYTEELKLIMNIFETHFRLIKVSDLYRAGYYDKYTMIYMNNIEKVKNIIRETSNRELSQDWSPIMAICENCKRIDSTKILEFKDSQYRYICRSCGHTGENSLDKHMYKLQWRLHWPTWQSIFNSDIEGGGVDHFTKGGSRDTAERIHREILGREPPIGYKYGFVLLDGKKYSKSKGIGMYVRDMIKIIPPEIIAYHLLKYDLEENIDFNPTKEKILNMIDDYENASKIENNQLSRADRKRYVAFRLFGKVRSSFKEMLLYYSIYRDWEKVKNHIKIDEYYKEYIENWFNIGFVPDEYNFSYNPKKIDKYRELVNSWKEGMGPLEIHNSVYDYARSNQYEPAEVFKYLYNHLIGKDKGPRLGKLIYALGVDKVKRDLL